MRTLRGRFALVAAMVALVAGLAACGGDDNDSAGSSSGTATSSGASTQASTGTEGADEAGSTSGEDEDEGSPESRIAPDAEVTAGLGRLKRVGDKVAAAADGDASKAAAEGLEPVWQPIEGTVKKNEPDIYLDIEDSFQRMESGDLDNAKRGAQSMQEAVDAYLAKHPG
jgi:hypothetical protein